MNVNHGITDTGKLKTIEIDKYEPIPDKPGRCRAVGQASKQEIFDQLKDHLEYVGMLPDEYFIISTQQPEIIPEIHHIDLFSGRNDSEICCTVKLYQHTAF